MTDWRPLGTGAIETLVAPACGSGTVAGFTQSRCRRGAADADLTFIAPALTQANGAALFWGRLITDSCQWLGAREVERVHAAVVEDDQVALQVFRGCGFAVCTTDVVLARSASGSGTDRPGDGRADGRDGGGTVSPEAELRAVPMAADTELAVRRLAHECLPDAVRAASDELGGDWFSYPLGGFEPGPAIKRAWVDPSGVVQGAWRVIGGRDAHWLQALVRPGLDARALVRAALADVAADRRFANLPILAAARGYESELNLALRECGFEPRARRFRLVKQMAVRVMAPAWHRGAVRDHGLDPAPSSTVKLAARTSGDSSID